MGSYLLLVLLMGGVLYGYLSHTLDTYLLSEIRKNLFSEARLARLMASDEIKDLYHDAPAAAAAIGRELQARVTVIAADGRVVGDSDVTREDLGTLENHLERPEVQEALKSGSGSALRWSATIQTPMLYAALPLATRGGQKGFLRLALPLSELAKTKSGTQAILGAALAIALLISFFFSWLLSNFASRTVKTMAALAAQLGRGEPGTRIPVGRGDELGELASVMNDMAVRIEGQLERISTEKNRLDAILRGMGEGLMVTDARGTVTLVNPAFRQLFPAGEEVVGKPLIEISRHPLLGEAFRRLMATRGDVWEEIELEHPHERILLTHWVPLVEDEAITGVVAVFHDISDIRRVERMRRDFVANVSHELRTPVTVIKGYTETLLADLPSMAPQQADRFIRIIHTHSERLATLIHDLLTLSQTESGESTPETRPTDPVDALAHACPLVEGKALDKGIELKCDIKGIPPVMADQARLEQVFINLLENAVKYTPERGKVEVSAAASGDWIRIDVRDTGIGIPEKELPRIFERFYRVDAARTRDEGGTGLGLSIVKHLVQAMGGSVSVESAPGKGSVFSVTLKKA